MSQNPFNPSTWPAYQAWEKSAGKMMDTLVRDPFMLGLSGRMLTGMLQSKKFFDRMLGIDPAGRSSPAAVSDVVELQQRVLDLERRIALVERTKKEKESDA